MYPIEMIVNVDDNYMSLFWAFAGMVLKFYMLDNVLCQIID